MTEAGTAAAATAAAVFGGPGAGAGAGAGTPGAAAAESVPASESLAMEPKRMLPAAAPRAGRARVRMRGSKTTPASPVVAVAVVADEALFADVGETGEPSSAGGDWPVGDAVAICRLGKRSRR